MIIGTIVGFCVGFAAGRIARSYKDNLTMMPRITSDNYDEPPFYIDPDPRYNRIMGRSNGYRGVPVSEDVTRG